jgi:4-diphosphocytidyl-2-C-methyl-D-erythritol kinase
MSRLLQRVEVEAAAKVNVGWRVGARRADGYHDVCGLMQTISLLDRIEITTTDGGDPTVAVSVPGHPDLEDGSNLVHEAANVLSRVVDPLPTAVVIHKAIPVAAGLGGGSADAAAALVGLNAVWGGGLTARELAARGAEIGSDVPAILAGGLVHASGRGERVRSIGSFDDGWLIVGVSNERVSAADAYASFDRTDDPPNRDALFANDLQAAACELVPGLSDRVAAMEAEAGVAFVSGSGPTVVGVVADEAYASGVAARVRERFADVLVARPITWGVRLHLGTYT